MARLFTLAAGFIFVAASSVIVARVASASIPTAYLLLALVGVSAIGGIVLLARQTLRNPWTALGKADAEEDPAEPTGPDRARRRVAP
ncbi:hypothetical protein ACGFNP_25060 [Nonomuraea sp. NPDC049269]|uniref:hypothetical protein n=1 Tax=Nonomuraea sp. NPDC049269 TaxID=3364349 RepID=UPI0037181FB4